MLNYHAAAETHFVGRIVKLWSVWVFSVRIIHRYHHGIAERTIVIFSFAAERNIYTLDDVFKERRSCALLGCTADFLVVKQSQHCRTLTILNVFYRINAAVYALEVVDSRRCEKTIVYSEEIRRFFDVKEQVVIQYFPFGFIFKQLFHCYFALAYNRTHISLRIDCDPFVDASVHVDGKRRNNHRNVGVYQTLFYSVTVLYEQSTCYAQFAIVPCAVNAAAVTFDVKSAKTGYSHSCICLYLKYRAVGMSGNYIALVSFANHKCNQRRIVTGNKIFSATFYLPFFAFVDTGKAAVFQNLRCVLHRMELCF